MNKSNHKKSRVVKISYPSIEEMPDDIYANNISVSHGPEDIILYFAKVDLPPLIKEEEFDKNEIMAKVVARIRLSPTIVPKLINILQNSLKSIPEQKEGKNVESSRK